MRERNFQHWTTILCLLICNMCCKSPLGRISAYNMCDTRRKQPEARNTFLGEAIRHRVQKAHQNREKFVAGWHLFLFICMYRYIYIYICTYIVKLNPTTCPTARLPIAQDCRREARLGAEEESKGKAKGGGRHRGRWLVEALAWGGCVRWFVAKQHI